jgi:hypothetical protein
MVTAQSRTDELTDAWRTICSHLERRKWAVAIGIAYVAVGLLYTFFWGPVVDHSNVWEQPGDLWATFRVAHLVGWGDVGDVYVRETGFITTPGIALLLTPVALLSSAFHWSESFPYIIFHPSGWPALIVATMGLGIFTLVALDALAEHLGVSKKRRIILSLIQAAILFNVDAVWGHPEDAVAVAFGAYGLLSIMQGHTRRSGWCFGLGIAFQPFVLLALPVALARMNWHDGLKTVVRAALPAVLLLAIPVTTEWSQTSYALIKQPTYPTIDHPTPLLPLAVVLHGPFVGGSRISVKITSSGERSFVTVPIHNGEVVSPGFCRLIALLAAIAIGILSRRRRSSDEEILWFAALAFAAWCAVEPVMTPYYLWPTFAFVIAAGARRRVGVLLALGFLTIGSQWWAQRSLGEWAWYGPIMGAVAVMLWISRPESMRVHRGAESPPAAGDRDGGEAAMDTSTSQLTTAAAGGAGSPQVADDRTPP